ncbi:uncharacterized protein [Ptychodera flava]|uniref:uncharacterized protein n=1 Tax=Ptychodera flava TaxID=63121 RepID=UPI00396A8C70
MDQPSTSFATPRSLHITPTAPKKTCHKEVGRNKTYGRKPIEEQYLSDDTRRIKFAHKQRQGLQQKVRKYHICTRQDILLYVKGNRTSFVYGSKKAIDDYKNGNILKSAGKIKSIDDNSTIVQPLEPTPNKDTTDEAPHADMFKPRVLSKDFEGKSDKE